MSWYNDVTRRTQVKTYTSERLMRAEVEAAARFGFTTQSMTRKGNQWTVVYQREERAWARIQVESALHQLVQEQSKLRQAKDKVATLHSALPQAHNAARSEISNPTQLEQRLMKSIANLILARQAANAQRQIVIVSYSATRTARAQAAGFQVSVPQAEMDIETAITAINDEMNSETESLQRERAALQSQQTVTKSVQEWQKVVGDRWGVHTRLAKAQSSEGDASAPRPGSGPLSSVTGIVRRLLPTADAAKLQAALETFDQRLQDCEASLLRDLEERDKQIADVLA